MTIFRSPMSPSLTQISLVVLMLSVHAGAGAAMIAVYDRPMDKTHNLVFQLSDQKREAAGARRSDCEVAGGRMVLVSTYPAKAPWRGRGFADGCWISTGNKLDITGTTADGELFAWTLPKSSFKTTPAFTDWGERARLRDGQNEQAPVEVVVQVQSSVIATLDQVIEGNIVDTIQILNAPTEQQYCQTLRPSKKVLFTFTSASKKTIAYAEGCWQVNDNGSVHILGRNYKTKRQFGFIKMKSDFSMASSVKTWQN